MSNDLSMMIASMLAKAESEATTSEERLDHADKLYRLVTTSKHFPEAMGVELLEKALAIHRDVLPAGHEKIADDCIELGSIYSALCSHEKAASAFETALAILEKSWANKLRGDAALYYNLAATYLRLGRCDAAIALHDRAIATEQKALPAGHLRLGLLYGRLAMLYVEPGLHERAEKFFEMSLGILNAKLGKTARKTQPVAEAYAEMLEKTGRSGEAKDVRLAYSL